MSAVAPTNGESGRTGSDEARSGSINFKRRLSLANTAGANLKNDMSQGLFDLGGFGKSQFSLRYEDKIIEEQFLVWHKQLTHEKTKQGCKAGLIYYWVLFLSMLITHKDESSDILSAGWLPFIIGTVLLLIITLCIQSEEGYKIVMQDTITSLGVLVIMATALTCNEMEKIHNEDQESSSAASDGHEEHDGHGHSNENGYTYRHDLNSFAVLVISLSFGLIWFRWRFPIIVTISILSTTLWAVFARDREDFVALLLQAILFDAFLMKAAYEHERSLRKEFKNRRKDSFKVQVLQERVEALQTGNEKEEKEEGLDMTGRAQKALRSLQSLAENPSLSPDDKQAIALVKKTLLSSETFDVDVKRQLAQGKGTGLHSEMQHWLASQFKSGIKYNVDGKGQAAESKPGSQSIICSGMDSLTPTALDPKVFETWDVDVFAHCQTLGESLQGSGTSPFVFTMVNLFKKHDLEKAFSIPNHALFNFMFEVERGYLENPYHNYFHAMDVTLSMHYILTHGGLQNLYSTLDMFASLVAAVSHDVEHVGRNNNFMIETNHKLALRYNDTAVMENHHAAFVFFLSKFKSAKEANEDGVVPQDMDCDIFQGLDREQYKLIRKIIIDCILSTDLGSHFGFMAKFNATTTSEDFKVSSKRNRVILLQGAIKLSDVGHTSKGPENHMKWTERIMEEFFQQGDHEKRLGVSVSAFMDREKMVNQKGICQEGFLNYVVMPLFKSWTALFPESQLLLDNLQTNFQYWKDMAEVEKTLTESKKTS